jgi:phospholipid transport system substrate-binding protein
MRVSRRGIFALALLPVLGPAAAASADAGGPAATITAFYDALLAVMKASKTLTFDQRYARLQPAISRTFNLTLMTRIAIGPQWVNLPPPQQQELLQWFARYTISTYASRFDGYSGERFVVEPQPVQNPNGVIVESRLLRPSDAPVTLDYLMRRGGDGAWQVIDVFLSGTISELATRRSEFVAVLGREGAEGLVRLLEKRVAALRTG